MRPATAWACTVCVRPSHKSTSTHTKPRPISRPRGKSMITVGFRFARPLLFSVTSVGQCMSCHPTFRTTATGWPLCISLTAWPCMQHRPTLAGKVEASIACHRALVLALWFCSVRVVSVWLTAWAEPVRVLQFGGHTRCDRARQSCRRLPSKGTVYIYPHPVGVSAS